MEQTSEAVYEAAVRYTKAKLSVIPIRGDGSKAPALPTWKEYQRRQPTDDELEQWFGEQDDVGIAVLGGQGLEILDFDEPGLFDQFREVVDEQVPGLVGRLPRVDTPSGGVHLYYRCETIAGNQKLAERPPTPDELARKPARKIVTLIETRGEGGYVVAPPSPACCHPDGLPYVHAGGPDLADVPHVSPDHRQLLHEVARSFGRIPDRVVDDPQRPTPNAVRPGDDFNAKVTWHAILEPAGWTVARQKGPVTYWKKPDASGPGHHATTGHCGDRFFCFSTNAAPFVADTAYTKFTAYALLRHGGDFAAASRELAAQGYGQLHPVVPVATDVPNEAPDDPHRLARLFVEQRCRHPEGLTLRYWQGGWHRWDRAAYHAAPESEVRAHLCEVVKAEFDRVNLAELKDYERRAREGASKRGEEPPTVRKVTQGLVGNVVQALAGLTVLPTQTGQPAWVGPDAPFPADEVLAAGNGLVHLPSLVAGEKYWLPPTPSFFSPNVLDYDFVADAPEPAEWLRFLNGLWLDDPQSVEAVQDWFGYCLLPDTRQQKMLLLVGPKRSGKGTIGRVLRGLVGDANVAGPTLSSLATSFGLWPLLGKTVAIISDARLGGRTDLAAVTERLLSISGEDTLTIDRKHLPPVTVKLPTRFVILTNELPRVSDSSGALPNRMVLLRLTRSWYGHEDPGLTDRLLKERPGILRWAIEGWKRLRDRGHFVQPDTGRELREQLEELGSPIQAFLKECCVVGSEHEVGKQTLYDRWTLWCGRSGREHAGDKATLGRNLLAAVPAIRSAQRRSGDKRVETYVGIGLVAGT